MGRFVYLLLFICIGSVHAYGSTICDSGGENTATKIQQVWKKQEPEPPIGRWINIPNIRICKDAPVTEQEVRDAVSWWSQRGHQFGPITPDTIQYGCIVGSPHGSILIQLVSGDAYEERYAATTAVTHDTTPGGDGLVEIHHAVIKMKHRVLDRVLEHEIGHALGFMHTNETGHLMHKNLVDGGWNDRGLRNQ